ncbi:MAG: cyclic nucleotide-binding domain-containing protein [Candidatus Tritonobacter lacicola]|nr:cyclic nucleotide-binding domain-containing protein [Candidatus Tritonobacter lacicola]
MEGISTGDVLKGVSLFSELTDDEIDLIVPIVNEKAFKPGETIIEEGKPGKNFYVIAEGMVEIRKRIEDGREKLLAALEEGTFFGEIALFDRGLRTASVRALEDTTILEIDGDRFNGLISSHPAPGVKILRAMMAEMVYRLRRSNETIRDFVIWAIYGKKK